MLKKSLMAAAIFAAFATTGAVLAADAPAEEKKAEEPKPSYTLTGNFGVFSQYIFRGLTQTGRKPAAQGGFDLVHESGFYAGTWMSNVSWLKENASTAAAVGGTYGEGGSLEMDFYGGYKWSLPNDFTIDIGTLYYYYPGNVNNVSTTVPAGTPKGDNWEIYIAPSWKFITFKLSDSTSWIWPARRTVTLRGRNSSRSRIARRPRSTVISSSTSAISTKKVTSATYQAR